MSYAPECGNWSATSNETPDLGETLPDAAGWRLPLVLVTTGTVRTLCRLGSFLPLFSVPFGLERLGFFPNQIGIRLPALRSRCLSGRQIVPPSMICARLVAHASP